MQHAVHLLHGATARQLGQHHVQPSAQAVALAKAVKYQSAGTVEFVVGKDQSFYFLEMNTRLQVEHPVTEAITGLDLVEWQFRVAAGEPLPLKQAQLKIHGHAIEARICAENPDKQFLPATGTLQVYRQPACTRFERSDGGVRIDDGVREGDAISPYYDSMVAKLIVHGDTREQALARMQTALNETVIEGISTNVPLHRELMVDAKFMQGGTNIHYLEKRLAERKDKGLGLT